ncbi:hypothetical protein VP01_577g5 [Puccinia sorghi]|uniref:Uncharacterized protein n=1 Tax=Puccinia sorghi TaxID=27349 RepID=A0A0L6UI95_9BASI|nr:hypothetical protein VP01_577g5 [Puccinia sorghi]
MGNHHWIFSNKKWAANSGYLIYLDLQEAMINCLKLYNSLNFQKFLIKNDIKFNIIHDMGTKKGIHFCFIVVSFFSINNDFNYFFQHLLQLNIGASLLQEDMDKDDDSFEDGKKK